MSKTIIHDALKKILGAKTKENLILLSDQFKLAGSARSKYRNLKVYYKKDLYDSLSEAYYAYLLDTMVADKKIKSYTRQTRYKLQGRTGCRSLAYKTDFTATGKSGREYIIDIKGRILPEANVKLAYFEYVYKMPVYVVMTTGPDKFDVSFII
jgi:hypothetical protein